MQLSKSDYMLFLKQPAWLWVKKQSQKSGSSILHRDTIVSKIAVRLNDFIETFIEGI